VRSKGHRVCVVVPISYLQGVIIIQISQDMADPFPSPVHSVLISYPFFPVHGCQVFPRRAGGQAERQAGRHTTLLKKRVK